MNVLPPRTRLTVPLAALAILSILSLLITTRVLAHEGHNHGAEEPEPAVAGVVTLSEAAVTNLDLQSVRAERRDLEITESLFATIEPLPARHVRLSAPFSGRVSGISIQPGQFVKKGTTLLRADPLQVGGGSISIAAPFDGHVLDVGVSLGQSFTPEETLVEFANLDQVQLRGQVYDLELLKHIRAGLPARATIDFAPDRVVRGVVEQTAASLRPGTLTYDVFASFENVDHLLLPNSTARLAIVTETRSGRIVIPAKAILGQLGEYFVFVRGTDTTSFERRPLTIGFRSADGVEVLSGVREGEEVVTRGNYQLQFVPAQAAPSPPPGGPAPAVAPASPTPAASGDHDKGHDHGEHDDHDHDHEHGHDHPHEH